MTYASVIVQFPGTTLTGYLLDDGKVQFLMGNKMIAFDSLMLAVQHWLDTH